MLKGLRLRLAPNRTPKEMAHGSPASTPPKARALSRGLDHRSPQSASCTTLPVSADFPKAPPPLSILRRLPNRKNEPRRPGPPRAARQETSLCWPRFLRTFPARRALARPGRFRSRCRRRSWRRSGGRDRRGTGSPRSSALVALRAVAGAVAAVRAAAQRSGAELRLRAEGEGREGRLTPERGRSVTTRPHWSRGLRPKSLGLYRAVPGAALGSSKESRHG